MLLSSYRKLRVFCSVVEFNSWSVAEVVQLEAALSRVVDAVAKGRIWAQAEKGVLSTGKPQGLTCGKAVLHGEGVSITSQRSPWQECDGSGRARGFGPLFACCRETGNRPK